MAAVAQDADSWLILALAAMLCALALWRRPAMATTAAGLCGLLCVTATCFPMLAKTVYPYYLFEPYVMAAVWWLARSDRVLSWRVSVPLLLTFDAFLAKWNASLPLSGAGLAEGVASSIVLAMVIALVMIDLVWCREPSLSPATSAHRGVALAAWSVNI